MRSPSRLLKRHAIRDKKSILESFEKGFFFRKNRDSGEISSLNLRYP